MFTKMQIAFQLELNTDAAAKSCLYFTTLHCQLCVLKHSLVEIVK